MNRRKILTVVGTRPQFIKAASVSKAIAARGDLYEVVVHTGQHFDDNMSTVFFQELDLTAQAHALGIHGGDGASMTSTCLPAARASMACRELYAGRQPNSVAARVQSITHP